jgi:peptidoglycan/xylan/chitin deacetylase (PgdA/CDA1 family)
MGFSKLPMGTLMTCQQAGLIALTFDDGITRNTQALLTILEQEKVKATFFIVGETLMEKKGLPTLQQIKGQGHFIANHTWTHLNLTKLSDQKLTQELLETQSGIDSLYDVKPKRYLRPPYGGLNQHSYDKATALGFKVVLWNFDSRDWESRRSRDSIWIKYQKALEAADPIKDSFIILLHERKVTLALLADIIQLGREKGFKFVTMDECLP